MEDGFYYSLSTAHSPIGCCDSTGPTGSKVGAHCSSLTGCLLSDGPQSKSNCMYCFAGSGTSFGSSLACSAPPLGSIANSHVSVPGIAFRVSSLAMSSRPGSPHSRQEAQTSSWQDRHRQAQWAWKYPFEACIDEISHPHHLTSGRGFQFHSHSCKPCTFHLKNRSSV